MTQRLAFTHIAPAGYRAMSGLEAYVRESGLEPSLLELVRLRSSQINGCAYCIDMHWKDARARGETEQRLYGLSAWREAPYYTPRERAALDWAETVTRVGETQVPDEAFEATRQVFTEKELVDLTYAVVSINAWNRLAIAFRSEPGVYQPRRAAS